MFNRSKAFGVLAFVTFLGIHALAQSTPLPVTLSSSTLAFGNQGLNGVSTIKSLKVTNSQSLALNIASVNISGDFAIASSACGTTLAPKASCLMTLSFTPTLLGLRSGTLTLTNDASNSPQTVALTGTGVAPAVAAPSALTFGNQAVGSASTSKTLTLTNNNQTSSLNISKIGTVGDFVLLSNGCGAALAPRANCVLTLAFNPTALGIASGTLTVTDDAGNSPQTVAASGTGVVPVGVSPALVNFGNEALSGTSTGKIVTVVNHSQTASLNIANTAITGDFSIASNGCGTMLAAKASCAITIAFTPGTLGSRSGTLTLTDDAGTSPQGVALIGTGVIPVALFPATLGFGNQALGSTSAAKVLKVTNNNQTVGVDVSGVNMVGNFALASNGCGTMLAPKTSCTMTLTFSPNALGAQPGSVSLTDDAGNSPQVAVLTGTGVVAVAVSPAAVGFGNQAMGSTSTARKITVINNQNVALNLSNANIAGDFAIASNDCGAVVAPKASCTVMMTFAPTVLGGRTGLLTFTDDANNAPQTVAFSGSGVVATLVSPAALSFGNQLITTAGAAKTVTLTNNQDVTLNISSIVITGDYVIQSNSCGTSLAAKTKCSITVVFQPVGLTARTGTLTINDDAGNSGRPIALTGNGVTTGLTSIAISPAASSIAMGASQQFSVGGTTTSGSSLDLTSVATWSSLSATVVTINSTGLAVSLTTGASTIKAVLGTLSSSSSLNVTPPSLTTLTLSPVSPSVPVGQTIQFMALGTYSDASTRDLTSAVIWASSDTSVVGINNNPGFQGLATAIRVGTASIAASSGTTSASILFTVPTPPAPPAITGLFPAFGPSGTKVSISGSGFGVNQGGTSVSIAGIPLIVSGWSDTAIVAMVPSGAMSGRVIVSGASGTSNALNFTVVPGATVTDVSPVSGLPGTQITISGSNFGVTQGNSGVLIGSTVASVSNWSDTQIVATVALGSTTGAVSLNISGVATLGPAFTVPLPTVRRISPASGGYGTTVIISGTNFGSAQNGGAVTFSGVSAAPLSWTDTTILVTVPSSLTLGDNAVIVTAVGWVAAGPGIFTLNPSPVITSISPAFGAVGTEVVVSGTDLGPHPYRGDRITFGGIPATATSWTATSITVTVPSGVMSGPNPVIVSGPKGDSPAGIYFTAFVQPEVDSLSPSAGPGGTFVTIRGSGFGLAQGSGAVSVGGVVANATSWSALNIVVVLPANLPSGVNPVVVSIPGYGDIGSAIGFIVQQNPAVSSLSSPSGTEGTTVTINGANFGATQGTSTVMFNNVPGTIATWSDGAIVVNVPAGANTGPVLVNVKGVDSNGRRFMVGDVTLSISVTPKSMAMLVGESKPLTVVDATGNPLSGATWQISDPTIGSISTDDPAMLTASASGQATLTASYNGLSAQAVLNSYAGSTLPLGTEIWSIAPNPGPYSGFWRILQTVPTSDGTVDLIGIQFDNTVVGLSANGAVVWTATLPPGKEGLTEVPDNSGGLIDAGLNKIDGKTGQQVWSSPDLGDGEIRSPLAIHPDGTIFTTLMTPTPATAEVIGIDSLQGNVKFRIPLEQSSYTSRLYCIDEVYSGTYIAPASTGSMIVGPDGNAYLTYSYNVTSQGSDESCSSDAYWGFPTSFLKLMKVDSTGSATSTLLKADSSGRRLTPGMIIPDGQGGFLITQDGGGSYEQTAHILHVASTGGVTDFTMAPLRFVVGQLILGENGTAFATDRSNTVAFDINTGQERWTWPNLVTFIAASAGGGLVAKDGTQFLRFDANGIPILESTSALGGSILDTWGTSGIFSTMADGSLSLAQSMPFSVASSYWALPSGNSSHNNGPTTIPVTLRVHRFSDSNASVQRITDEVFVAIDFWRKKGIILNWQPQRILAENPCIDMTVPHCWDSQPAQGSPVFNDDNLSFVQDADDTRPGFVPLDNSNAPYLWKLATHYRARFPQKTGIDVFFLKTVARVVTNGSLAFTFKDVLPQFDNDTLGFNKNTFSNQVLYGPDGKKAMAHEIGHALSLHHYHGNSNLMCGDYTFWGESLCPSSTPGSDLETWQINDARATAIKLGDYAPIQ